VKPLEVYVQLSIWEPLRMLMCPADHQRGLADPGHAANYHDRPGARTPNLGRIAEKLLQFGRASDEVGDAPR
jgi:hypothetical protein